MELCWTQARREPRHGEEKHAHVHAQGQGRAARARANNGVHQDRPNEESRRNDPRPPTLILSICAICYFILYREYNGDKTRNTRKDTEGKEGATQVCYHVMPHRAHGRSNERKEQKKEVWANTRPRCKCKYDMHHARPIRATNRDQQRCGTNQGAGRGKGKRAPAHACPFLHREYNGTATNNTRKGVGTGRET